MNKWRRRKEKKKNHKKHAACGVVALNMLNVDGFVFLCGNGNLLKHRMGNVTWIALIDATWSCALHIRQKSSLHNSPESFLPIEFRLAHPVECVRHFTVKNVIHLLAGMLLCCRYCYHIWQPFSFSLSLRFFITRWRKSQPFYGYHFLFRRLRRHGLNFRNHNIKGKINAYSDTWTYINKWKMNYKKKI